MPEQTTLKDWLPVVTALIVAIPAGLGWLQSRKNAAKIEVVRTDVNDKMQQFIAVTKTASHAEGVLEEKNANRDTDPLKVELVEPAPVPVKIVSDPLK